MLPNKALKMLGFVPQPNLPWSGFLGKTYPVLIPNPIKWSSIIAPLNALVQFCKSVTLMPLLITNAYLANNLAPEPVICLAIALIF